MCVFSSHSFWTSSSLDVPAGVTQEEGHTGFLIHLLSAVRALIFLARMIQTFLSLVDREVEFCVIIIIIIISAHKSDLSNPWSHTQASLSIPSLHPKKKQKKHTNKKREREEKNNRRENLPRSDRRGREKIKQEQKNKSKDPPRISERQIDKQARQTKCQDHTNCRYRTRVAKHTPPVAGGGAADSQALRQGAPG